MSHWSYILWKLVIKTFYIKSVFAFHLFSSKKPRWVVNFLMNVPWQGVDWGSDPDGVSSLKFVELASSRVCWGSSISKHCFNGITTLLMLILSSIFVDVHDIATSVIFQAILMLNCPCKVGSIIFLISPAGSFKETHLMMWVFSVDMTNGGWPVKISKRTTPKL